MFETPVMNFKWKTFRYYKVPNDVSQTGCLQAIESMPEIPLPEAMGLNENAAISRDTNDSDKLLVGVRLTQPISGDVSTSKDVTTASASMLRHVEDLIRMVAMPFDMDRVYNKFPISYDESLNTVLRLELNRFNRLLVTVRSTLTQLQQALKGEIVMSIEMEEAYECVHQVRFGTIE